MTDRIVIGSAPRRRVVHRAAKINDHGDVSAVCFRKPHAINLRLATWSLRDEPVTCQKCLKLMQHAPPVAAIAPAGSGDV